MNVKAISYIEKIRLGDHKALARVISLIESETGEYEELLKALPLRTVPVIGITGPPGAGKSTIADCLISELRKKGKKIAVLCVDPSSPFSKGALLGDRVRMHAWYNDPNVFIRSFASRGSLGGLHPKMIEVADLLKAAHFDYIIVETVGVGQSEVEIAGLADITLVVLVPEAGDDIQAMKAGLMEIADIFIVNKCDRPGADQFIMSIAQMRKYSAEHKEIPIVKTIATQNTGIQELLASVKDNLTAAPERKLKMLTEKAYQLIVHEKIKHINKADLESEIEKAIKKKEFNLYKFVGQYKQ